MLRHHLLGPEVTALQLMNFGNNLLIDAVASSSLNSLHEDESSSQRQATAQTGIIKQNLLSWK